MEEKQDPSDPLEIANDIAHNKFLAVLSYVGILVLVPIFFAKESRFAQFHANQGVILLLASIIVNGVGAILPVVGLGLVIPLGNLIVFILAIIGIINAIQGKEKELPLIGQFKLM